MICSICGKQFEIDEQDILQVNEGEVYENTFLCNNHIDLVHSVCLTQPTPHYFLVVVNKEKV